MLLLALSRAARSERKALAGQRRVVRAGSSAVEADCKMDVVEEALDIGALSPVPAANRLVAEAQRTSAVAEVGIAGLWRGPRVRRWEPVEVSSAGQALELEPLGRSHMTAPLLLWIERTKSGHLLQSAAASSSSTLSYSFRLISNTSSSTAAEVNPLRSRSAHLLPVWSQRAKFVSFTQTA